MKEIQAQVLNRDTFYKYGEFTNLLNPQGPSIGSGEVVFYRDALTCHIGGVMTGFSTVLCQKRAMIITEAERHMDATEILIPLDDDVVVFAAAAGDDNFNGEGVEAFIVPKGYAVSFRPGVWHKAQFPINNEQVSVVCILPERTYARDCLVVKLRKSEQILIKL